MGWSEIIGEVKEKVVGVIEGTFRPLDGIPFVTVCYPPEEERTAIKEFTYLSQGFKAKGILSEVISMKEVLKDALVELGVTNEDEENSVVKFERSTNREELKDDLSRYLPEQVSETILRKLKDKSKNFVAVLIRTGALYPFVTTSSIRAKLENTVKCVVIIAYPANNIGEMLNDSSFKLGGYYRGEIIYWR